MKKILEFYNKLEAHLLVCSLIFTVILVFLQVVLRYIFGSSLSWSEELARYIFIWQIWLGTSLAQRDGVHVRFEMLGGKNEKAKSLVRLVADVVWLIFCILIVVYGFQLVSSIHRRGLISAAMQLPMYLVYLCLPLSQLAVSCRIVGEIRQELNKFLNIGKTVEEGGEA